MGEYYEMNFFLSLGITFLFSCIGVYIGQKLKNK